MPTLREIEAMREERRKNAERPMPVEEALARFWELAGTLRKKDGVEPLGNLAGLWIRKVDERWLFKANGHREAIDNVPPFSIYVEYNGWPAGVIDPGGAAFAAGTLANIQTFNAALEACINGKE